MPAGFCRFEPPDYTPVDRPWRRFDTTVDPAAGPDGRMTMTRRDTDTWITPRFAAIFGDTLHDF